MDYTSLTPVSITADNEAQLQAKLYDLGETINKMVQVISIYPKGSKVIAWIMMDKRYLGIAPKEERSNLKKTKKKTKKKVTKKA